MGCIDVLKRRLGLFCLALWATLTASVVYGAALTVTYGNGESQSMQLRQAPGSIRSITIGDTVAVDGGDVGEQPPPPVYGAGRQVTVYWHMADDADLYLNGRPLRNYEPSFKTRGDEAPRPAFSAPVMLREGDVFTVGGRRGGSFGFMLIAVDRMGQVVFKTDQNSWMVYEPGEEPNWFLPDVAKSSPTSPVTVQRDPWYPQKELNAKYGNTALSIWSSPDQRFAYMYGIVSFLR